VSLQRRLVRLEGAVQTGHAPELASLHREAELHCKLVENARREMAGEEPEPLTPEEEALCLELDLWMLEEGIPHLRAGPGWQSAADKEKLEEWERDIRERLQANDTERTLERR
jgi:hypothetical protein